MDGIWSGCAISCLMGEFTCCLYCGELTYALDMAWLFRIDAVVVGPL